ncbi:hypothetical protein EDD85DRAFT_637252 [Armillaria nabsnona]|nr:hypothetical protein EDD85DRAFT_637252 [Armillaria nabsnona]
MCYRKIDSTRYSCGHDTPHGDQRIDCNSARCRYSSAHPDNNHDCKSTCKQWLRPSQNVVTKSSHSLCYHCSLPAA